MYLLNSSAVLKCETEEAFSNHDKEIAEEFGKLATLQNYECAVLRQRQDPAASNEKTEILSLSLHDLTDIFEMADIKNGVDLLADENLEFLIVVTYGQTYEMDGRCFFVTDAYKILPYDDDKDFLNVMPYIISNKPVVKAKNQFEETNTPKTLLS